MDQCLVRLSSLLVGHCGAREVMDSKSVMERLGDDCELDDWYFKEDKRGRVFV